MTTFHVSEGQNLDLALPVEWLRELPARHKAQTLVKDSTVGWLPEALRTRAGRLARLQEAKQRLQAAAHQAHEVQTQRLRARAQQEAEAGRKTRRRKPKAPAQVVAQARKVNLTDPDSRIVKPRQGGLQGYHGQAMADCTAQVLVACAVTQEENDVRQLAPMLDRCVESDHSS